MNDKRLTLIAYGGDRELWRGGPLTLTVWNHALDRLLLRRRLTGAIVELTLELPFDQRQAYPLQVTAARHRGAWHLISRADFIRGEGAGRVERDDTILRLLLVPKPFVSADLADGWHALQGLGSPMTAAGGISATEYAELGTAEQMALLNIEAKLRHTFYPGGETALSLVRGVRRVFRDRVFVYMAARAKELTRLSPDFGGAPGHDVPGDAPWLGAHPDSWKHQQFVEGNLQLCFARDPESYAAPGGTPEPCYAVEADIDLGRGISHAAEWLRNNVLTPGHKTEQDVVYGMLYDQNILPAYTLQPAPAAKKAKARRAATPRARGLARPTRKKTATRGTTASRRARRPK